MIMGINVRKYQDLLGKVRYKDYGTTAVFRIKDTLFTELGQE